MATHTFVDVQLPEAEDYAALSGVRFDLFSTRDLCGYLNSQFESGRPNTEVIDAFSTAILVRYCRAFPPGIRKWPWEDALASLTTSQRENHERFRNFRSMHVAHSLNAFEDNRVQARYCLERVEDDGITSISASSNKVVGLNSDDINKIIDLCNSLIEFIETKLSEEQARLLPLVRAMPLKELIDNEPPLTGAPNFNKIHVRRDRP